VVEVNVGLVMVTNGGFTTTVALAVEEAPMLSVTVAFTVYVPAVLYWCEALTAEAELPSPKEMTVLAIVPSGSLDAAADAEMDPPTRIDPELKLNAATGGLLTVTLSDLEKFCPALSHPFTSSVCVPPATVIVVSRFAEFTE
jgi:hypothetical protein